MRCVLANKKNRLLALDTHTQEKRRRTQDGGDGGGIGDDDARLVREVHAQHGVARRLVHAQQQAREVALRPVRDDVAFSIVFFWCGCCRCFCCLGRRTGELVC